MPFSVGRVGAMLIPWSRRLLPAPLATAAVVVVVLGGLLGAAALLARGPRWHASRRGAAIGLAVLVAACAVALSLRDRRRARRRLSSARSRTPASISASSTVCSSARDYATTLLPCSPATWD